MTFVLAFIFFVLVIAAMAVGVALNGRTIQGSCGGLNAAVGADACVVCKRPIDKNSKLHGRLDCPRAKKLVDTI
ncbi:MAG: (Na+)-NQR maturation NqrM [Pseudomonadota bacterium]